jgi:predicted dehydrogenase
MPEPASVSDFEPFDRPVRAAIVGLGRVYDLNARGYVGNPDVEVVALVDPSAERRLQRQGDWPNATAFSSIDELAASGLALDAVELLVPIVLHEEGAITCLNAGWHVNLQKPLANDLASAQRILDGATRNQRVLRVMENYLFYEPLVKLKETLSSGVIGEVSSYHVKMVASGRGGWDVPGDTYEWQFQQAQRGRGVLLFDDGWHKLSTALWLFGPVKEVRAWVGATEVVPGITVDAPTTLVWEHENGVRGVWDITLAVDMYLRSDYYTNDERWEVTGRRGFARVNRCTARGIQQPSFEVYVEGEMRAQHALDDDWASSFRDSGRHWLRWLRTGDGPLLWSANEALEVLRFALAAYESSEKGGVGVNPASLRTSVTSAVRRSSRAAGRAPAPRSPA